MPIIGEVAGSQKTVPGAPGIVSATDVGTGRAYNNGAVTVVLSAPAYTGRLPITSYTVTPDSGSASSGASTTQTLTGFGSGSTRTFTAYATNAVGNSANAGPTAGVLVTTVPQAPTITSTTAGNGQVTVFYSAGASGGKTISTYTVTSSPGGITAIGSATNATVTGLTNGTAYTFTVTATNANGVSAPSAASSPVTPVAPGFIQTYGRGNGFIGSTHGLRELTNGNIVAINNAASATQAHFYVLNSTGTLQSQRILNGGAASSGEHYAAGIDNSDNIIIGGRAQTGGVAQAGLYKMNSAGTMSWAIRDDYTAMQYFRGNINFDSSNNIYASGVATGTYGGYAFGKFSSAGVFQWGKYIQGGRFTGGPTFSTPVADSSGNVYSFWAWASSSYFPQLVKYDSTGNQLATLWYGRSGHVTSVSHLSIDSSNNIYALSTNQSPDYSVTLFKCNSSLGVQWQRRFINSTDWMIGYSKSVVDSNGDIYCTLPLEISGPGNGLLIVKYNSSGVLQWQRLFQPSSEWFFTNSPLFAGSIALDGDEFIVTAVFANGGVGMLKAGKNGSGTGTYNLGGVTYTYSASSYTETSGDYIQVSSDANFSPWTPNFVSVSASTNAAGNATELLTL